MISCKQFRSQQIWNTSYKVAINAVLHGFNSFQVLLFQF